MKWMMYIFLIFTFACAPSSVKGCQKEAKKVIKRLVLDLKQIQSSEEIALYENQIEEKIQQLVEIAIRLKKLQDKGGADQVREETVWSDALMQEMLRIYQLGGGREEIERLQHEALLKLDAFQRKREKQHK